MPCARALFWFCRAFGLGIVDVRGLGCRVSWAFVAGGLGVGFSWQGTGVLGFLGILGLKGTEIGLRSDVEPKP